MDRRFAADEWEMMTVPQRITRCTILAEGARKMAENASQPMRVHYLKLAHQWLDRAHEMAGEIMRNSN